MTSFDRFQWQNAWIDDPRVYDELISVLSVLLRYVNFDGICYPSQATIAEHLCKSPRTVRRRLTIIEEIGYLKPTNRSQTSTIYRAEIPKAPVTHDQQPVTHDHAEQNTPVTHDHAEQNTPVTHDQQPVTSVHKTGHPCPQQNRSVRSPMTGERSPMTIRPVTHDHLTVFEQSNEQYRSSSCKKDLEVLEKPKSQNPPPQPPAEILLDFCKQAEIEITVFQAENLWTQVRSQLVDHDIEDVWDYFRWKLSDLAGTEFPTRAKLRFLAQDVSTWLDIRRKRAVGRNDFQPAPTPAPAPTTSLVKNDLSDVQAVALPAMDAADALAARQAWAAALPALQASVSQQNFTLWLKPLKPLGIQGDTFHLDAGDGFKAAYTNDNYRNLIIGTLAAAGADVADLKFHPELST